MTTQNFLMGVILGSKMDFRVKSPTSYRDNLNTQMSIGRQPFDYALCQTSIDDGSNYPTQTLMNKEEMFVKYKAWCRNYIPSFRKHLLFFIGFYIVTWI